MSKKKAEKKMTVEELRNRNDDGYELLMHRLTVARKRVIGLGALLDETDTKDISSEEIMEGIEEMLGCVTLLTNFACSLQAALLCNVLGIDPDDLERYRYLYYVSLGVTLKRFADGAKEAAKIENIGNVRELDFESLLEALAQKIQKTEEE